jgi:protein O-mannosyl-transferase
MKSDRPQSSQGSQSETPGSDLRSLRGCVMAVWVGLAVVVLFSPVFTYPFLNWDDQEVFVRNTALHAPGLLRWALTTTYIDHYQPLAWLTWGAIDRAWTLTPAAAHIFNAVVHAACAVLVFVLAHRLSGSIGVSATAALLFALHPLRVEVVAWASAMPYALALLFALLSTHAFLDARDRWPIVVLSIALYALSLLARPIALGLPVALFLGVALRGRGDVRAQGSGLRAERGNTADNPRSALSPLPSALVSTGVLLLLASVTVAAAYVESHARTAAAADVSVGARLTLALTAPFRYLWRTIAPFDLTPLDPLALTPRADVTSIVAAGAALVAVSWAAWRWRRQCPGVGIAWVSYLALLAPAAGLLPSGLQATADRYSYLPSVPLSIGIAAAGAAAIDRSPRSIVQPLRVASAILIAALAWIAWQQTRYWRDSVTLWTRAVAIDPASDLALYNLASALAAEGRRDEALARYEDVLRIVPDQADARRNRDLLLAARTEDEANRLAASGNLDAAIDAYRRTIALDPARTHAQASLGIALVQRGRTTDALPPLREAVKRGALEPAVPNALAFVLMKEGRTREACDVLENARVRFPDDLNIARNLAQLECQRR